MANLTYLFKYDIMAVDNIYNNMTTLEQLMDNFYLDEKEAKVYLASLELGRSKVSEIAKKAELNRITAYEILKRFVQQGIAGSTTYNQVKTFTVISPEILVKKMESKLKTAENILPQLSALALTKSKRPQISFYEGREGIRTIYEDTLTCQDKVLYNIANPQKLLETIGTDYFKQYLNKRLRKKIKVFGLLPDTQENLQYKKEQITALREVRFFNAQKYELPNEIIIYDNKVAELSFSSKIGVIIEDRDIAQSLETFWQMVWDQIK